MNTAEAGWRAAERAAREAYGRLVALLAWRWRDLAAAEDALGDAFAAALEHWPASGVPASPEAWLMQAAKRRLLEQARHRRVEQDPALLALFDAEPEAPEPPAVPDARLKLLFVCAHPALAAGIRAPLMLQTVLGLDARAIASAFLVAPATMAQRLVRAKAKIRDAGIGFDEPEARELPGRLAAVLESIYGAYTIGTSPALPEAGAAGPQLVEETLFLARLVVALMPAQPEAMGLLALLLHAEARRPARFEPDGRFVPLHEQDTTRWQRELIAEADRVLIDAARCRQPGAFQLEAAIQSAHSQRAFTGRTPWRAIAELYELLMRLHPGVGAAVGRAVALGESGQVDAGLAALDALPAEQTRDYQAYWVTRAHLQRLAGRGHEFAASLERAIGLTEDGRVRGYLIAQLPTAPRQRE